MSCKSEDIVQKPIQMGLDPSRQVKERDIHDYQLPEKIGGKWKDLARALDSSDHCQANINRIQKDQGGSTKECCIEALMCWRGREGRNATVGKLAEALVKAELKNIADELMCMDMTPNDRINMTLSQMQTNCNCKHLDVLKEEICKMRRTIKELENKYQDAERENSEMCSKMEQLETRLQDSDLENSEMRSKMEQLETMLQDSEHENSEVGGKMEQLETRLRDSEHECATLRTKILELRENPAIQRKQQQDSTEQVLSNSVDAATELEDVSGATGNDLDTDQEIRERRIAIQLKNLDGKLKKELTSLLQVPEIMEDKLKTPVKLDLLTRLSESLQNIYSDIQAMVAETCKCNEDLKREFYDFAYHSLRAEHNDLVHRVNDLESSQAEMSDEEKKAFKRLQHYQSNRQRQIHRLENVWRGLFSSPESLPETSSSYPTSGNDNSKKALSRNRTDPGTRQKQTSAGTPPMSDEEKSEVCIPTIKKRSTMKKIFRSKESKENLCHPVSYRPHRDS